MAVYWILVGLVLLFRHLLPQTGPRRGEYILLMAVLQSLLCGLRDIHLTGDLITFHNTFLKLMDCDWFSEDVLHGGRNALWYLLQKFFAHLTNGNFSLFLMFLSIFSQFSLALVIYRYSTAPWLSYLVWNCLGFYLFGFNSIKQALAMSLILLAYVGVREQKPLFFLTMTALASLVHLPALIFLPAYGICRVKMNPDVTVFYVVCGILLYAFKQPLIQFVSGLYYPNREFVYSGSPGNRFIMIVVIALCAVMFRGFSDIDLERLFHLMVVAAMLQMLSGYGHLFTRLTDYYFQFSALYIPVLFFPARKIMQDTDLPGLLPFNDRSLKAFSTMVSLILLWFYYAHCLDVELPAYDDYTNYRFLWEIRE